MIGTRTQTSIEHVHVITHTSSSDLWFLLSFLPSFFLSFFFSSLLFPFSSWSILNYYHHVSFISRFCLPFHLFCPFSLLAHRVPWGWQYHRVLCGQSREKGLPWHLSKWLPLLQGYPSLLEVRMKRGKKRRKAIEIPTGRWLNSNLHGTFQHSELADEVGKDTVIAYMNGPLNKLTLIRFEISAYPSLLLIRGEEYALYMGERNLNDWLTFLEGNPERTFSFPHTWW